MGQNRKQRIRTCTGWSYFALRTGSLGQIFPQGAKMLYFPRDDVNTLQRLRASQHPVADRGSVVHCVFALFLWRLRPREFDCYMVRNGDSTHARLWRRLRNLFLCPHLRIERTRGDSVKNAPFLLSSPSSIQRHISLKRSAEQGNWSKKRHPLLLVHSRVEYNKTLWLRFAPSWPLPSFLPPPPLPSSSHHDWCCAVCISFRAIPASFLFSSLSSLPLARPSEGKMHFTLLREHFIFSGNLEVLHKICRNYSTLDWASRRFFCECGGLRFCRRLSLL